MLFQFKTQYENLVRQKTWHLNTIHKQNFIRHLIKTKKLTSPHSWPKIMHWNTELQGTFWSTSPRYSRKAPGRAAPFHFDLVV